MHSTPSLWSLLKEHVYLARTLRRLEIHFNPEKCRGVWQCYEVCPVGCWTPNRRRRVVEFQHGERCVACGACVVQCPQGAIELKVPDG